MTRILLLNCSPHGDASHGYRLAREIIDTTAPAAHITERDLSRRPLPPIDTGYAQAITASAAHDAKEFATSERLITELEEHDLLVITTPMHNFTVPAALKLWLDHIIRIHRSFRPSSAGKVGLIKDIPTVVIISSGGYHAGDRANQQDFLTPYLRYALASIGINNATFLALQGTAFGPNAAAQAANELRPALLTAIATATQKP